MSSRIEDNLIWQNEVKGKQKLERQPILSVSIHIKAEVSCNHS